MRVKCVRNPYPEELHRAAVTVGSDYVVLAISANSRRVQFRILENRREDSAIQSPILRDSSCFEVVSGAVPSNWRVAVDTEGRVEIAPEPWLRREFWEEFFDSSDASLAAREDFERELAVILDEETREWRAGR